MAKNGVEAPLCDAPRSWNNFSAARVTIDRVIPFSVTLTAQHSLLNISSSISAKDFLKFRLSKIILDCEIENDGKNGPSGKY